MGGQKEPAALLALCAFIVLGVLFFVFVIPRLSPGFQKREDVSRTTAARAPGDDPAQNFSAGTKLIIDDDYPGALVYFQKAVDKDPDNPIYLGELARAHYLMKDYDEAIEAYEKLIAVDGAHEGLYDNYLGNLYDLKEQHDRAEYYLRRAIGLNPRLVVGYSNLAYMLAREGRQAEAIRVLEDGIRENDGSEDLAAVLAVIRTAE